MTPPGLKAWTWVLAAAVAAAALACGQNRESPALPPAVRTPEINAGGVSGSPGREPTGGDMSLKQALLLRRSVRSYADRELTEKEILALLWACQGITARGTLRTAPSAGATYPLVVHALTPKGVFQYVPEDNVMRPLARGDRRAELAAAALDQSCVSTAPLTVAIGGVIERTAKRYGPRAMRYVAIEAGAAAQNLLLMAASMKLGAVMVGAYDDDRVRKIAMLPEASVPLIIIPVGAIE